MKTKPDSRNTKTMQTVREYIDTHGKYPRCGDIVELTGETKSLASQAIFWVRLERGDAGAIASSVMKKIPKLIVNGELPSRSVLALEAKVSPYAARVALSVYAQQHPELKSGYYRRTKLTRLEMEGAAHRAKVKDIHQRMLKAFPDLNRGHMSATASMLGVSKQRVEEILKWNNGNRAQWQEAEAAE